MSCAQAIHERVDDAPSSGPTFFGKPAVSRRLVYGATRVSALALLVAVNVTVAGGQARASFGIIEGAVTDTSLVPLAEATVSILGSNLRVVTGANGRFRISDMSPGQVIILVRRIGFEPLSARVVVTTLDTARVSFALERATTTLGAVVVTARPLSMAMAEFEERRKFGVGQFMTLAEIEKRNVVATSDLLRTFTGLGKRGATSFMAGCARPVVFLDGIKMPQSLSIDDIAIPRELAGIEFYTGPAQIPVQYKGSGASCGVILLWTRTGTP